MLAIGLLLFALIVGVVVARRQWRVPWYFDCRHSREWSDFREALRRNEEAGGEFSESLFWWAQAILERVEPIYLKVQNDQHMFYLCDPDNSSGLQEPPTRTALGDTDSVFMADGGTESWTPDQRQQRASRVQDFCYFGYYAALAYRTRLTESPIRGVHEGRTAALGLLQAFIMSRSNVGDFTNDAGWPQLTHSSILQHLYHPAGLHLDDLAQGEVIDDTDRPMSWLVGPTSPSMALRNSAEKSSRPAQSGPRPITLAAFGYHTSLVLEPISVWLEHLQDDFTIEVAGHILEPGVMTPADNRKASLCRHFFEGSICAWDSRLFEVNAKHVGRGKLARVSLPSPRIADPQGFLEDFVQAFRAQRHGEAGIDHRLDSADLQLCTEPAFLCGAVALAWPDRPTIGYFANPLASYLPQESVPSWLAFFRELVQGEGSHFLAAASTRYLAEQMQSQSGAALLAVRPLALYLGAPTTRSKQNPEEVVVLRVPSVFWNANCILNSFVQLNLDLLAAAHLEGGSLGIPVPGLRFQMSEDLVDASSEALSTYEAVVVFPYDVSQMRLYELYALGVPILLPPKSQLPSYLYRGLTTIDDFDVSLPDSLDLARQISDVGGPSSHLDYNPFERRDWHGVWSWSRLTHWMTLPHLIYCDSVADMLIRLARDDLRPTRAGMRKRQQRDVVRAVEFWRLALRSLL